MKNCKLCLIVFLITIRAGFAQDLLIKNNGDTIRANILEVTDNAFRYKKSNNPDGPTFVTNRSEISRVVYSNGTEEKIEVQAAPPKSEPAPPKPAEPNIDTRSGGDRGNKYSNPITSDFEEIQMERFGYYYKGMRMNDNRLNYLFRSFNDASILKDYKSAKSMSTTSKIVGLVGIPLSVTGVIMCIISFVPHEEYDNNTNDYETTFPNRNLLGPGIGLFAGFVACEVASGVMKGMYKSKLKKTVQHYNSVVSKHEVK